MCDFENKWVMKLEEYFHNQGMTPFSSRVCVAFFQKSYSSMPNVTKYLLSMVNGKQCVAEHEGQRECPNIIPGLRSLPRWDTSLFPFISELESHYGTIRDEFLKMQGRQMDKNGIKFQPYRAPVQVSDGDSLDSAVNSAQSNISTKNSDKFGSLATNEEGKWNVCYLQLHESVSNDISKSNLDNCPAISKILSDILPRNYHHALISCLTPGSHILPHHGPTNKKLRVHLPLVVPSSPTSQFRVICSACSAGNAIHEGGDCPRSGGSIVEEIRSCLRVHDELIYFEEGQCFIFDDSFEHEVYNPKEFCSVCKISEVPACMPRVTLIMDIWHPDLADEEVKFLRFIENHQMKNLKKLQNKEEITDKEATFLSIILDAKQDAMVPDSEVWGV